jgi:hypothetical protein
VLQYQGGGLQQLSYWARKLNHDERGNSYFEYELEAFAFCDASKHWVCYPEGCYKFLVTTVHDTPRHLLWQPNNMLNKRQACCMRYLQPFLVTMTLAYHKRAMDEANPLGRRLDFEPHATFPLFCDGEVPSNSGLRRESQSLLDDAHLNSMTVKALRLSHEFADFIRKGYTPKSRSMGTGPRG